MYIPADLIKNSPKKMLPDDSFDGVGRVTFQVNAKVFRICREFLNSIHKGGIFIGI